MNPNIDPQVEVANNPDENFAKPILDGMQKFAIEEIGGTEPRKIGVKMNFNREFIGGATGQEVLGGFYLNYLLVDEKWRGKGMGTKILQAVETAAVSMSCREIWLETMNARAVVFYKKHGYEIRSEIPEYFPGFKKVFMKKIL